MKLFIALAVIILLAVAGYFAFTNRAAAPVEEAAPTEQTEEAADESVAVVTYTDAGFSPASITVQAGDTVRFSNSSSHGMWVASDDHPTHTQYDGTSTREHCADGTATTGVFDQCSAAAAGSSWEYTFTKAGTWGYHNHARSGSGGTVIVTE